MEAGYDMQRLLVLRKLTVAISKLLSEQMRDYLTTLAPLLRPKTILGEYVHSSVKEHVRAGADKAFKDLQTRYEQVAGAKPFYLPTELKPPIEVISTTLEFTPLEYAHVARTGGEEKTVIVTSPLTWVLNYSGFPVARLRELVADRNSQSKEIREYILHYLILQVVLSRQAGLTQIMEALHFPITTDHQLPELGNLPLTHISSSLTTHRPPDSVIIEGTEISGRNVFEEIINLEEINAMRDPLRERLTELVNSHDPKLLEGARPS